MPSGEEGDVEEDNQPEVDLKSAIAPLVTKEPLSRQRPRPAAAEGEKVQVTFSDALAAALGREFVEAVDDKGDGAEQAVEDNHQRKPFRSNGSARLTMGTLLSIYLLHP